jgi:hypothetical protein
MKIGPLLALPVAACLGCSTTLTVTKLRPGDPPPPEGQRGVEGIRYALPVPFLLVCPGAAGSLDVSQVYLPDPRNQYAIDARSRWARHDLNVSVENGLLTKVEWNPGGSEVAAKGIEASADLAKTAIEKQAEAKKQARADAEEQRKKDEAAAEAADKAVSDAEAALASAQAVLDELQANGASKSAILDAKLDLVKARKRLEAAVQARDRLSPPVASRKDANALEDETRKHSGQVPTATAQGCVLFRVVDPPKTPTGGSTKHVLLQVNRQEQFDTSVKLKPTPTAAAPDPLQLRIVGSRVIRPAGPGKLLSFRVESTAPLDELPAKGRQVELDRLDGTRVENLPVAATLNSATTATVELSRETPDGQYVVKVPVKPHGRAGEVLDLEIEVQR